MFLLALGCAPLAPAPPPALAPDSSDEPVALREVEAPEARVLVGVAVLAPAGLDSPVEAVSDAVAESVGRAGPPAPAEPAPSPTPSPTASPRPSATPTATPTPVPPAPGAGQRDGVPVLMYHYVRVNPNPSDTLGFGLSVTPADFEAQMAFLEARGYRSELVGDLAPAAARAAASRGKVVAITFDDGYADAYLAAYPSLRRHGLRATFYVITGLVGRPSYLTWEQVRALADGDMGIGSHTISHPELPGLKIGPLQRELVDSRAELERRVGRSVLDFSYPSGHFDQSVEQAVGRAGYRTAVTVRPGFATPRDDPLALPRVRVRGGMSLAEFAAALGEPPPAR